TFSISHPVIVQFTLGLFAPRLDEKTFSLGQSVLRPTHGRTLLILQSFGSLSGDPKVDYFRHVNERRYLDVCLQVANDPLFGVNYADTVTLDHRQIPPLCHIPCDVALRQDVRSLAACL